MVKVSFFYKEADKNICFAIPSGYDEMIVEPDGKRVWVTFLYPEPEPPRSFLVPFKYYEMRIEKETEE